FEQGAQGCGLVRGDAALRAIGEVAGGDGQPLIALDWILDLGAAGVDRAQLILALGRAFLCRALVPLRGFGIVLRDALAIVVDRPHQQLHRPVALLGGGRPARERTLIVAAAESAPARLWRAWHCRCRLGGDLRGASGGLRLLRLDNRLRRSDGGRWRG